MDLNLLDPEDSEDKGEAERASSVEVAEVGEGSEVSGSGSTQRTASKIINPWPYLANFFKPHSREEDNMQFHCVLCLPKKTLLKCHATSLGNLKTHVKRCHASHLEELDELARSHSGRGKKREVSVEGEKEEDDEAAVSTPRSAQSASSAETPGPAKRQRSIATFLGGPPSGARVQVLDVQNKIVDFFVNNMLSLKVMMEGFYFAFKIYISFKQYYLYHNNLPLKGLPYEI